MPDPFRFFDLPVELQLHVMECSPVLTYQLIDASEEAKQVFLDHSGVIIASFLKKWPQQLQNLIRTILAVNEGVIKTPEYIAQSLYGFAIGSLQPRRNNEPPETNEDILKALQSLDALRILRMLLLDLEMCADVFVHYSLTKASERFKAPPVVSAPPFSQLLSSNELYRFQRAFLRWALCTEIKRKQIKRFKAEALLKDLASWEIDELLTVLQFFRNVLQPVQARPRNYPKLSHTMATAQTFVSSAMTDSIVQMEIMAYQNQDKPLRTWVDAGEANCMGYGLVYAKKEIVLIQDPAPWGIHLSGSNFRRRLREFGFSLWDESRICQWVELPKSHLLRGSEDMAHWAASMERRGSRALEDTRDRFEEYREDLAHHLTQRS